jgi:CheY-like chemotaxis protein
MDTTPMPPGTVLVVDDDALINIGTVDMVQDLGFATREAYSGHEALDILANDNTVGVLITDYGMPGMTGLELAEKARAMRPGLHVVLATGYDELPDGHQSDLPRINKPFQQQALIDYLQSIMSKGTP